jgi:hypothetical protein
MLLGIQDAAGRRAFTDAATRVMRSMPHRHSAARTLEGLPEAQPQTAWSRRIVCGALKVAGAFLLGFVIILLLRWLPLDDLIILPLVLAGAVLGISLQRFFLVSILGFLAGMVLSLTPPFHRPEEIILMDGDRGAALVVSTIATLFPLIPGLLTWALAEVFRYQTGLRKK